MDLKSVTQIRSGYKNSILIKDAEIAKIIMLHDLFI